MIEKDPPFFWDVSCDQCSSGEERIDTDTAESFLDLVQEIKSRDWRVMKKNGEWHHICPTCAP